MVAKCGKMEVHLPKSRALWCELSSEDPEAGKPIPEEFEAAADVTPEKAMLLGASVLEGRSQASNGEAPVPSDEIYLKFAS